ncbi:MAG: glycosyltransferase [Gemmatimonadota bacterium]
MNILMVTNTFTPHVGGVANSVASFSAEYRRQGHRVLVVAPVFAGAPDRETDVIRVPAIQKFNGSDFSLRLPIPGFLFPELDRFRPDVVHAHHPYLLGDTALRIAAVRDAPLVFTHHTMYEQYTRFVPGDSPALRRFVVELSTGYANLCDGVIAPSDSVAAILRARGVSTAVAVIPTGVDRARFAAGDGARYRASAGIPADAFVVGSIGRLSPEKNLRFLAEAVCAFLAGRERARFLVAGVGPSEREVRDIVARRGMSNRLHFTGILRGRDLADAYRAMDVFAFASRSETQGMVLAEALAAGVPAVALDAPGVREAVTDGANGILLPGESVSSFREALERVASLPPERRRALRDEAARSAARFSMETCAARALDLYGALGEAARRSKETRGSLWASARRLAGKEWKLWASRAHAAGAAIGPAAPPER